MKECPRCLHYTLTENEVMNALSRRNNKTYICPNCGTEEAMIDASLMNPTVNEKCFVEELFGISYSDWKSETFKRR